MNRPYLRPAFRFHPRPLMILAAVVLCLVATLAFGQSRSVAPATRPAPANGTFSGTPSASGLTSGSAPGLANGMPSASGLTSGTGATTLPAGSPSTSGLSSGSGGAAITGNGIPNSTGVGTSADTTATTGGGSTRGVIVLPADASTTNSQQSLPAAAGVSESSGAGAAVVITPGQPAGSVGGPAGASNGVPSVSPNGRMAQAGPITALQAAQMFRQADGDGDGLLTRAEALRLPFVTMTFEDMDTNRDGVVSRSEYESSLR